MSPKEKRDFVSSFGYALGYIGGGILFLINVLMYLKPELFGISDAASAIKLAFLTVAIWWAVFSIPIMVFVKEPSVSENIGMVQRTQTVGTTSLSSLSDC